MPNLLRLTYASRVALGVANDIPGVVADILKSSINNNSLVSVTGLLINHAGFFVQSLEGPPRAVEATYTRVADDRRHRAAKILLRETTDSRLFGSWAMCASNLSTTDAQILKVLSLKGAFDPFSISPQSVLRLLTTVAGIHSRADNLVA